MDKAATFVQDDTFLHDVVDFGAGLLRQGLRYNLLTFCLVPRQQLLRILEGRLVIGETVVGGGVLHGGVGLAESGDGMLRLGVRVLLGDLQLLGQLLAGGR